MAELYDISRVWSDWKTVRFIGEGSFGKVYEITRDSFGTVERCALKVITIPSTKAEIQSLKNDGMDEASVTQYYKGLVEDFAQEISLMCKLRNNPNIVQYEDYEIVEHQGTIGWDILIRMELLQDFPGYLRKNAMTQRDIVRLGIEMCNALEICAESRIIHRDLKPDNIFVADGGSFKLGDFGVARTIEKTVSGLSKKGTYTYMAPEVYKGEKYGLDVDTYSLGIVMYKLLNFNREPFLPEYPETIKYSDKNSALVSRMNGTLIPAVKDMPDELNRIILKACAFRSEDRYKSASEMKDDLKRLFESSGELDVLLGISAVTHPQKKPSEIPPAPEFVGAGEFSVSTVDSSKRTDVADMPENTEEERTMGVITEERAEGTDNSKVAPIATSETNRTVGVNQTRMQTEPPRQVNNTRRAAPPQKSAQTRRNVQPGHTYAKAPAKKKSKWWIIPLVIGVIAAVLAVVAVIIVIIITVIGMSASGSNNGGSNNYNNNYNNEYYYNNNDAVNEYATDGYYDYTDGYEDYTQIITADDTIVFDEYLYGEWQCGDSVLYVFTDDTVTVVDNEIGEYVSFPMQVCAENGENTPYGFLINNGDEQYIFIMPEGDRDTIHRYFRAYGDSEFVSQEMTYSKVADY